MPRRNHFIQRHVPVPAALAVAVCVLLTGCGSSSPAQGAAPGGANSNPACQAAEKAYSSFLASYTPAGGGDWNSLATALEKTINSGNENTQLGLDIFGLSQDAAGYASDVSQGGGSKMNASTLQPFDDDLQAVANDCGTKLTPPQPADAG